MFQVGRLTRGDASVPAGAGNAAILLPFLSIKGVNGMAARAAPVAELPRLPPCLSRVSSKWRLTRWTSDRRSVQNPLKSTEYILCTEYNHHLLFRTDSLCRPALTEGLDDYSLKIPGSALWAGLSHWKPGLLDL